MRALRGWRIGALRETSTTSKSSWSRFHSPKPASTCKPSCATPKCTNRFTRRRRLAARRIPMPDYQYPGVYVQEMDPGMHPIDGVSTTNVAFVGFAQDGPFTPTLITGFLEFTASFGGVAPDENLAYAVQGFFNNGGVQCYILRLPPRRHRGVNESSHVSLAPLDSLADVSIVCCPDEHSIPGMTAALVDHCEQHKDRVAILAASLDAGMQSGPPAEAQSSFVAYYMPWVLVEDAAG